MSPEQSDTEGTTSAEKPVAAPVAARRLPAGFATLRDAVLFFSGMAIIGNEVFLQQTVEPASIAVGLAMTGLPLAFGADERKKG